MPARGGRLCERFGGYKTLNRIPLPLRDWWTELHAANVYG